MNDPTPQPPEASVRIHRHFSLIWLVPLLAAGIAIYLGWATWSSRGPMITITFASGEGLSAGQTKLQHNAVALGTVQSVTLTDDFKQVVAKVRVAKSASALLTSSTRFWVERPRFSLTDVSGLQTLLSGSYIAVDPGPPGGKPQLAFRGLDQAPGVRSDQPGGSFTLKAPRLGWVEQGAPVFYHDIPVGQLIDYQEPAMGQPIIMHVFIKAPYDQYVHAETHFWNTSGLTTSIGPSGIHVAIESLQALLAGGIDFDNFEDAAQSPRPAPNATFQLFDNFDDAQNAGFRDNIHYVSYFNQSIAGLQRGSAVQLYGIRVGTVTDTRLELDLDAAQPRARVTFDVQPERIFRAVAEVERRDPLRDTRKLVEKGMRARIDTGNLITGQEVIGLDIVPNAASATVSTEGDLIIIPSQGGGLEGLADSIGETVSKLNTIPFGQLGGNANTVLASLQDLIKTANRDLKPIAGELPDLSHQLQTTLQTTNHLLSSLQNGYGNDSETHRNLQQLTAEATEAIRSIKELTTFLDSHPASVVWGRK